METAGHKETEPVSNGLSGVKGPVTSDLLTIPVGECSAFQTSSSHFANSTFSPARFRDYEIRDQRSGR